MPRIRTHMKTEAVDPALRDLEAQPMSREEALGRRGAHAIDEVPDDVPLR